MTLNLMGYQPDFKFLKSGYPPDLRLLSQWLFLFRRKEGVTPVDFLPKRVPEKDTTNKLDSLCALGNWCSHGGNGGLSGENPAFYSLSLKGGLALSGITVEKT